MEHRSLGRTGLKVSRLGLGCGNFGGVGSDPRFYGKGESENEAFALMDRALDIGINFFDTADAYGGGRSESFIGRWLKTKDASVVDRILVSSKAFNPVGPDGKDGKDGKDPNDRGLSRRHLKRQVERSLKRIGIERLDMFLIHEPDPQTPLEETLEALDDLVHAGKIHYPGASNIEAWRLAKALGVSDRLGLNRFQWVQNGYSLLERAPERDVFPLCAEEGLGFTPFSPLAGGWLTGKYASADSFPAGSRMTLRPEPYAHLRNESVLRAIAAFGERARERSVSMAALAIAWVLSHPRTTAVILGPRRPEHLDPGEQALSIRLSDAERLDLASVFEAPATDSRP
jgi:aryl-alcohol dehydrogenase-like predicted oxidoreductase